MALANGKSTASNNEAHCPIDKFLEFRKWNFSCWNKDVEQTEIHDLDNFIILDVWYTVKWAEWNDTLKQYTSRYFSNEIKDWKEKFYLIRTTFVNGKAEKELIKSGNWKSDIKPVLPTWAALHIWLTILDLNDWIVKEVFLSGNLFFKISTFIKWVQPNEVCWFKHWVAYTKWAKDDKGNEIMVTEAFVDSLKWTEAAQYKKRYTLDIYKTWATHDDTLSISTLWDDLDKYFEAKRMYYVNTYDLWIEIKAEQTKFFKLPEEEITAEDATMLFDPNNEDTEAELKKLNVPF